MGIFNRAIFMSTLLKDRVRGGQTPLTVVINITPRCNFKCGYCYGQYFKNKEKEFTTKELLKLIKDLAELGTRSITLGGGEPLIRDDIGQIIKTIKNCGMECGMNTNGSLIPQKIKELKLIDLITVSLDGPEKVNDLNRGKETYKKAMTGIETALAMGIKTHLNAVITKHNCQIKTIDWLINLAKEKKMQAEFNFLFQQAPDKNNSDNFMAENVALHKVIKHILEHKKTGAPILFSEQVYQIAANWNNYKQRITTGRNPNSEHIKCYAGKFMIFIDVDGKVYPCAQLIDSFPALDFRKVGILKAWGNCWNHPCSSCYFPCFNEFNQIINLNPKVIIQQALSSLKGY